MNTRQLQYIIALSEELSFSEAANKLLISQPSLSQYVQKLEKELGTELFERTIPIKLTYAGETYVKLARKILALEEEMTEKMTEIQGGKRGKINIGAGFLSSISILPRIVNLYQAIYSDVEIILHEDIEPNLKNRADAGELDLVFSTSQFDDDTYHCVELFQEEFLLAVPGKMSMGNSGHEMEEIKTIRIEDIKDLPFVMLNNNTYIREIVESLYRKNGMAPKRTVVCTSARAAYEMTKVGVGVTVIPYSFFKMDFCEKVDYYRLENLDYKRTVSIYHEKNKYIPTYMHDFIQVAEKYIKESYANT